MNSLMHHVIGQQPYSPSFYPRAGLLADLRAPTGFPDQLNVVLFESHWAWWIGLAVVGGLLVYLGLSRADRLLQRIGIATVLGTTLLVLLALLVVTPDERLYKAHVDLAAAAKRGDLDLMLSYFSDHFTINALGIHADTSNADAKAEFGSRLKEYGIKENLIRNYKFTRRGPIAVTDITVLTESTSGTILSSWEVSWDDIPNDNWKIARASLISLNNQAVPDEPIR